MSRPARRIGTLLAVLLAWFTVELFGDGTHVGLSERVLAGAQAMWPLCVAMITRPGTSAGKRTVKPPG